MSQPVKKRNTLIRCILLVAILLPGLLIGCATQGTQILKVDPRSVKAVLSISDEISRVLEELDYRWIPLVDPATKRRVKTILEYGQYRMRYLGPDEAITIDVHVRTSDKVTGLHFKQTSERQSNAMVAERFEQLKTRLQKVFGENNVRTSSTLLAP